MAGVNKVIVLGNLGADPEVRVLSSGAKVARLRIATSETYTNKSGERITNTEWHSVNVWRGAADIAEKYLAKGRQVYIEGKLRTRSYDDKEGITRYVTEIEADNLTLVGGRPDGDNNAGNAASQQQPNVSKPKAGAKNMEPDSPEDESFDDLPF